MSQPPVRENRPRTVPPAPAGDLPAPEGADAFAGSFRPSDEWAAKSGNRRRMATPPPDAAPPLPDPVAPEAEKPTSRFGLKAAQWQRLRQVAGLALLAFSIYLLVSLVAHLMTGPADESVVELGPFPARSIDSQAENSGGTWGAWLSEHLLRNGYGFIALLLPLYTGLVALALLEYRFRAHARRLWPHLLFWLHWTSFTFGTWADIASLQSRAWGGAVGTTLTDWTAAYLGLVGAVLISLFALAAYAVLSFQLDLQPSRVAEAWIDTHGDIRRFLQRLRKQRAPEPVDDFAEPAPAAPATSTEPPRWEAEPPAAPEPVADDRAWPRNYDATETPNWPALELSLGPDTLPSPAATLPAQPSDFLVLPDRDLSALRQAHTDLNGWPAAPLVNPSKRNAPKRGHVPAHEVEDEIEPEVLASLRSAPLPTPPAEPSASGEPELIVEVPPADPELDIPLTQDNIQAVDPAGQTYEKIVAEEDLPTLDGEEAVAVEETFEAYDPTKDLAHYQFPTLDLLKVYETGNQLEVNRAELEANKKRILTTLSHFNIEITSIKATIGPTVTLYEIVPAPGVRISKIKGLEDDIALSLAAPGIRIIAPMPGKGTIGIEIPNGKPETVSFRSLVATEKFRTSEALLPIAIGKTISNEVFIADLAKMPHLLVAGATGQGKSVGLNCILASLLYKKHPAQVKFVLIDPKKVEMTLFQVLRQHFLAKLPNYEDAIITDTKQAVHVLSSLCAEMDQRYELLKQASVRTIVEYNAKFTARRLNPQRGHRYLPYLVLVVDELADLMMTAGKEVEAPIIRLAQLGRAAGLHLIIATQRPSVNVITGIIKANFPARLSYRVISKVDSRTILDSNGAEQLVGRGDALLSTGTDLLRIQNAFVDTPEIEALVQHIGKQQGYPEPYLLPEVVTDEGDNLDSDDGLDSGEIDPLFDEAARLIVRSQQGSTSLIQRKMAIGYNRAGRLMDQLERAGICGAAHGSKPREVLVHDEASLEHLLVRLKSGGRG